MSKILIVDDSRHSRKVIRGIAESMGLEVCGEAGNGQEGFELYKQFNPDIVTLDITMPVCDGINALKMILEYDSNARAIMVTAAGQKGNVLDSLKLGAFEFVTKPYDADIIKDVFTKALDR